MYLSSSFLLPLFSFLVIFLIMTLFLLKDNNQIGQKTLSLNEAIVIYMRNYMFTY